MYRSCISSTLLSWISEDTYSFHNSFYFLSSWLENGLFALVTKPKLLVDKGMKSKTCTKGDKPVSLSHSSVAWKCLWGKKRLQEFGCTWWRMIYESSITAWPHLWYLPRTNCVFGKVGQKKKKSPECILSFKTKNNIIGGCQIQVSWKAIIIKNIWIVF